MQNHFPPFNLPARKEEEESGAISIRSSERDTLFKEAAKMIVMHQQGSVSLLQRRLRVGYARAARLIDELEQAGIVGAFEGSKAREVLVNEDELEEIL